MSAVNESTSLLSKKGGIGDDDVLSPELTIPGSRTEKDYSVVSWFFVGGLHLAVILFCIHCLNLAMRRWDAKCEQPLALWLMVASGTGMTMAAVSFTNIVLGQFTIPLADRMQLYQSSGPASTSGWLYSCRSLLSFVSFVLIVFGATWAVVGCVWSMKIRSDIHECPSDLYTYTWYVSVALTAIVAAAISLAIIALLFVLIPVLMSGLNR